MATKYLQSLSDEQRFVAYLSICVPLAYGFRWLPSSTARGLYLIGVFAVLFSTLFPFHHGFLVWLGLCGSTHSIVRLVRSPSMPWIACGVLIIHMFLRHYLRDVCSSHANLQKLGLIGCDTLKNRWITIALGGSESNRLFGLLYMCLYVKLTFLTWSVQDSRQNSSRAVSSTAKGEHQGTSKHQNTQFQDPTFLELTVYIMFFPSLFTGYVHFCQVQAVLKKSERRFSKKRDLRVLSKVIFASSCLSASHVIRKTFDARQLLRRSNSSSEAFQSLLLLYVICLSARLALYTRWLIAEASYLAMGMGKISGSESPSSTELDDIDNVNILNVEFAANSKIYWQNWNMRTHLWLKGCVYNRLPFSSRPLKVMITFWFSGVWHGLCFRYLAWGTLSGLLQLLSYASRGNDSHVFRSNSKLDKVQKTILAIFNWTSTQILATALIIPYIFRSREDIVSIWSNFLWIYIPILVLACFQAFFNIRNPVEVKHKP